MCGAQKDSGRNIFYPSTTVIPAGELAYMSEPVLPCSG